MKHLFAVSLIRCLAVSFTLNEVEVLIRCFETETAKSCFKFQVLPCINP